MKYILKNEYTIALLAALLFIPFLGHVHLFDWDEINFAESAREMIQTHNYFNVQINYERFWEKPPLFFWLQVASMKTFGINEFAARFPNAVCGIATLVSIFRIGKRIFNENLARIWVMIYLGTLLTFLYFKSGIIDPWFNLFIFLSICYFYTLTITEGRKRIKYLLLTGLFLGLATLTKGPVALLLFILSYIVYVIVHHFRFFITLKELLVVIGIFTIVCFAWFGVDLIHNGPQGLVEFVRYQVRLFRTGDADHGEPFFYHWWVLLFGCFPASIFFMKGMFVHVETTAQKAFKQWMMILFWVTLMVFSIVKTKIVHYSSLCWFPLTFIAAIAVYDYWYVNKKNLSKWLLVLMGITGIALSLLITAIPLVMLNKDKWINKIKIDDAFARGNLEAVVNWSAFDSIGGLIMLGGILFYFISKNRELKTKILFGSLTACCFLTTILIAPKIEAFSQRANIEFFEARQGEDCYVDTWDYKSYAQYFYTMETPSDNPSRLPVDSLLRGHIDKPAYISAKIWSQPYLDTVPGLQRLYSKNGFVFYKRNPK
jgi:4-amino-4-deoxy-L-arabinose transferase-like glycosyltransferase